MEEILASIRRIISEDDGDPADEAEEGGAFAPSAAPEPELEEEPERPRVEARLPDEELGSDEDLVPDDDLVPDEEPEDVLVLTDRIDRRDVLTDRIDRRDDLEPRRPEPRLVSDPTEAAAAAAFGHLSASLLMPHDLRTLEDVVRELLRPLLKQWLDDHLPDIVEVQVQAEIERISRGGRMR
jgi:cell pole-organizing protein PopZ